MTRSIPSISSLGNASPQSITIMLSPYSMAVMFIPICSSPPRGIILTLQFSVSFFTFFTIHNLFLFFFIFPALTAKSVELYLVVHHEKAQFLHHFRLQAV